MEEIKKHFERPTTHRPPSLFNFTFWAVFVGLVAGFGGYLLANHFLPNSPISYLNPSSMPANIKINLEQPLTNIAQQQEKSVAGIYRPVQTLSQIGQPIFSQADFLGSAVVVTSDGWLMTTNQVAKNQQIKVVLGNKIYDVVDLKTDDFSNSVFIKIEENSLQPINFQLTGDIKAGETLVSNVDIANSLYHVFDSSFLSNTHYNFNKYVSTDNLDYYLKIDNSSASMGAPYFNFDGDLLGLVYKFGEDTLLIPAEYLQQAIKHLLNDTSRPVLGLSYLDMENNSGFIRKGALVYNPQQTAITYNLPAYKAGVKVGDQIVAINNAVISATHTLTSIIQNYRQGDIIIMKVLRDGQELDLEISL